MMRILVTGGCGFISSHLCEALLNEGHFVSALDNLQTGSLQNVSHLLANPRFRFLAQDVELPMGSIDAVDRIYNLASPASPVHYQTDPVRTLRTNVVGALNVLELARRTGARVLQASTSEVYGDPQMHPQPENYEGSVKCFGPRACYDEGKRAAEALFHDYWRTCGVDIRIARIFNTYGPRMAVSDGRVVSNFVVQALQGKPITIYGDGRQTRSFCFVSDLVRGLISLMESGNEMQRPCNLGNPEELTIAELAAKVIALTGCKSEILRKPLPAHDPTRRQPDIALARAALDWHPTVGLDEGLKKTIGYFDGIGLSKNTADAAVLARLKDAAFSDFSGPVRGTNGASADHLVKPRAKRAFHSANDSSPWPPPRF